MHYNASDRNPGIDVPVAFVVVAQEPIDESRRRVAGRGRGVAVWRVADARQDRGFHRAVTFLLRLLDLLERAVLVVRTLDNEDGDADIAKRFGDVPGVEFRSEPRPAPRLISTVDVRVPAFELLAQIAGLIVLVSA